jgi:hypothetical protein
MGFTSLFWAGLNSRRFAGAISLFLGFAGCGGRAGDPEDVTILPPGAVPDAEGESEDAPTAGLPGDPSSLSDSPLVPLGREWQALATLQMDPHFLAADERFLYWVSPDVRRRSHFLRATSLGGRDVVTLVSGPPALRYLVPAGGEYVYFEVGGTGGRIARVPRTGGDEETIVSSDGAQGYAIDGDSLYWTEMDTAIDSGRLYRTSLSERMTALLAEGLLAPQRIALHGAFVYVASERRVCPGEPGAPATDCVGGGIHRVPQSGGAVEVVHAGGGTSDLVVNDGGLYWFDSASEQLMYAPLGGAEQPVAPVSVSDMGPFAFDAGALYWAGQTRVKQLAFGTHLSNDLGPEITLPTSVALANGWLYVAERGRDRIARTPTQPTSDPRWGLL